MGRGSSKRKAPVVEVKEEMPEVIEVQEDVPAIVQVEEVSIEEPVEILAEEPIVVDDVKEPEVQRPFPIYVVRVIHPNLRRRAAPSLKADVLGFITDRGLYDVFAEENGWGRLEDGSWILLELTEKQ